MRKIHSVAVLAVLALVALSATLAFGKSTSFIGGSMRVTGTSSAPSGGACSTPSYAANCPTAPSATTNCSCVKVMNAAVKGASIGKGTANLSFTEDSGDGDGTDGAVTSSNCIPVFGGGVFIDSKTAAQATLNIEGTLCGSTFNGGYSVVSGGTASGTVTGSFGESISLAFAPK